MRATPVTPLNDWPLARFLAGCYILACVTGILLRVLR
jgi:hypothetical protein